MEVTPAQMLDDAGWASRAKLIGTHPAQDFAAGNPAQGGTICRMAADEAAGRSAPRWPHGGHTAGY
ncbi:hypothetical protein [Acidovorax sp. M2(2025)]|uniref:hypothetical protein n=1 Tax=Acidovorax sp. M2(2025) TaxID=3411355 RepID=UPI003BF46B5B